MYRLAIESSLTPTDPDDSTERMRFETVVHYSGAPGVSHTICATHFKGILSIVATKADVTCKTCLEIANHVTDDRLRDARSALLAAVYALEDLTPDGYCGCGDVEANHHIGSGHSFEDAAVVRRNNALALASRVLGAPYGGQPVDLRVEYVHARSVLYTLRGIAKQRPGQYSTLTVRSTDVLDVVAYMQYLEAGGTL